VGYVETSSSDWRASRFEGRGRDGEEEGSNGGSRDAGRLTPATGDTALPCLGGDDSIVDGEVEEMDT
jgi:hypothetical protein